MYRNSTVICILYSKEQQYHWAPLFPIASVIHTQISTICSSEQKNTATKKTTNTNKPNKIKSKFIRNKRESIELSVGFIFQNREQEKSLHQKNTEATMRCQADIRDNNLTTYIFFARLVEIVLFMLYRQRIGKYEHNLIQKCTI